MDPGLGSNHNHTSTQERAFGTARVTTSDIRKPLKLSAKSITKVQDQYPLQAISILRHDANG